MQFGILFTSQPNTDREPYPHRELHARVTNEIVTADRLGYETAWLAEHHFSNEYGIMPDVWVYAAYLAALTKRIKIGMAVVTLPLANPVRVVENAAFLDILSQGRTVLGIGSGYRAYEFEGFGVDFETRRDFQEEALPLMLDLFRKRRATHEGKRLRVKIEAPYEIFPHAVQQPHPPLFMAGATDRSVATAGRMGMGLMLSGFSTFDQLSKQVAIYRENLEKTPAALRANPARGHVDVNRFFYVAESDEKAKRESEAGLTRHLKHFMSGHASGYLGQVAAGDDDKRFDYDTLAKTTLLHGSPKTLVERIEELRQRTGAASIMFHYPPWYGTEKIIAALTLFAEEVMPKVGARRAG